MKKTTLFCPKAPKLIQSWRELEKVAAEGRAFFLAFLRLRIDIWNSRGLKWVKSDALKDLNVAKSLTGRLNLRRLKHYKGLEQVFLGVELLLMKNINFKWSIRWVYFWIIEVKSQIIITYHTFAPDMHGHNYPSPWVKKGILNLIMISSIGKG